MENERSQKNKSHRKPGAREDDLRPATYNLHSLEINSFSALDTSSLSARVYDRLLRAIVRREFPAGRPLHVDSLADAFGVSRTPVQVAISRLAELGLVEIRSRKGTFVATMTAKDVHELFEIRGLIELHSAKKVIQLASDAELRALKDVGEKLCEFFSGDQYTDYHAFLEKDMQFHSTIVALARNERLVRMYHQARILIELTRASADKHIPGAAVTHQRHMAIADALLVRDIASATEALEKHTRESEEAIVARLHFPER
jgi:DNA-binding GntR family transcriptional regulator